MKLVIADTSPINYLILIGHTGILPALFEKVILPSAVRDELAAPKAPEPVRAWLASLPGWIEIRQAHTPPEDASLNDLDPGERDAIALATELHADLLLIDDRAGVAAARRNGLPVAGTLTILAMASERGLLDLIAAIQSLKLTNFHYRQDLIDKFIAQHRGKTIPSQSKKITPK